MLHNASIVGFAEGTHVLMADGKWKTIENVKQGDMVMSFNPDKDNSELEPRKVVDTWSGIHRDCIEVHQKNKVTVVAKDQLFFAPGAVWSQGFNTNEVVDVNGNTASIQSRNVRGGKWKIYDITVDGTHAFIANDMRVHNKKKKAPQPVVTAGKPGKPVTVSTTTRSGTTTVTVYPSPESSGQVSVSANGTIKAKQSMTPGVGADYVDYQTVRVLPYPVVYQYSDRVVNAQSIRNNVCGDILGKGNNYKVKSSDVRAWNSQFNDLISALNDIKKDRGIRYVPPGTRSNMMYMYQDSTAINDAIREIQDLKKDLKAGKKINFSHASAHCSKVESILNRLDSQCAGSLPIIGRPIARLPQPYVDVPERPVCPAPENYFSDRIYEDNANYGYYTQIGCTYVFDPPNAPAQVSVKYYKHWDSSTNKYYYDRISSNAFCSTAGGNTQA